MRRNDELIRRLMLAFEDSPAALLVHLDEPLLADSDGAEVEYFHLKLLVDAGLLSEGQSGVFRMTNDGHDWCGLIRDDGWWAKIKKKAYEVAPAASLKFMATLGQEMVMQEARNRGLIG